MSNLFGTDGIRGRVSLDACDDEGALERIVDQRLLTPQLMKLLGKPLDVVYQKKVKAVKLSSDGTIVHTTQRLQHG